MNINKDLRNGYISTELTKFVLFKLRGKHHIHWLRDLTAFNKMSKDLKWETRESSLFEQSNYSITNNLLLEPKSFGLFSYILSHKITNRKPSVFRYHRKDDANYILDEIMREFKITN
jgi:hypothetical protein